MSISDLPQGSPRPTRKRRRSASAANRDSAILKAARSRFAADGFEGASIADIALDAGVAVGTVYLRYRDKTELLRAVLDAAAIDFVAAMERPEIHSLPWAERLEPMFTALLDEAVQHPDLPALMRLSIHLRDDPGHARVRAAIENFIEGGQAAGVFRPTPVAPAAAIAFGMVQSAMSEAMAGRGAPENLAKILSDAATRWMVIDESGRGRSS